MAEEAPASGEPVEPVPPGASPLPPLAPRPLPWWQRSLYSLVLFSVVLLLGVGLLGAAHLDFWFLVLRRPDPSLTPVTSLPSLLGPATPQPSGPLGSPPPDASPSAPPPQASPRLELVLPAPEPPGRGPHWFEKPFLFTLADSGPESGEHREEQVARRLRSLVERCQGGEPPSLRVDRSLGVTVVVAQRSILCTVTSGDLPEYCQKLSGDALAQMEEQRAGQWAGLMQRELDRQVAMRGRGYRTRAFLLVLTMALVTLGLHWLVSTLADRLFDSPAWSVNLLLWAVWAGLSMSLFPESQDAAYLVARGLTRPLLKLIMVWLLCTGLFHLIQMVMASYFRAVATHRQRDIRLGPRLAALRQAIRFVLRAVLFLAGLLIFVTWMGWDVGQALTGAGVFGAALGFIGQDLVRDVISGSFILVEDQFGVGDMIELGGTLGVVESFNLRSTQLRSTDGSLTTVPNSDLRRVRNLSRDYSELDYRVCLHHSGDVEQALRALREEAQGMQGAWPIEWPPDILGVEELNKDGMVLRIVLRTPPREQFNIRRELNHRLKLRLAQEGLKFPDP